MKINNLIMIGLIIGIALFFVGMMVNNVFIASKDTDPVPYKVQAVVKLIGLGVLISSMVAGGIVAEGIDKNLKMLLLILGLVMLIIYTLASPSLEWGSPISAPSESLNETLENKPTGYGVPGFEILLFIISVILVLTIMKMRQRY